MDLVQILNEEQYSAYNSILNFVENQEDHNIITLTGFAGTGKSFLISHLCHKFVELGHSVCISAPTNKACKVISNFINNGFPTLSNKVSVLTCARLLGLKAKYDPQLDREIFISDKDNWNQLDKFSIVIIDECSMLSESLYNQFYNFFSNLGLICNKKLIFCGDLAQLPPVGEIQSLSFSEQFQKVNLQTIFRYSGPILHLSQKIREFQSQNKIIPRFKEDIFDNKGIFNYDEDTWFKYLCDYFKSHEYNYNKDFCRALAWTNKEVSNINKYVRKSLYGPKSLPYVPGELLIADSPCLDKPSISSASIILNTSEEFIIDSVSPFSFSNKLFPDKIWEGYLLNGYNESNLPITLNAIHPSFLPDYKKCVDIIRKKVQKNNFKKNLTPNYVQYYELSRLFHPINYSYAITVHKSQGSTYNNVFINFCDIRKIIKINNGSSESLKEMYKLLYVAITRATSNVFFLQ
ncbi:AAA family ATPase [Arthrospira platensis SPKY2]